MDTTVTIETSKAATANAEDSLTGVLHSSPRSAKLVNPPVVHGGEAVEKLRLEFPLPRTHCGMVMGNGNFGVLIWGRERLHITVNRADFWDRRGGELILPGTSYRHLVEVAQNQGYGKPLAEAIPRETFPPEVFKPQRLPVGRFEFGFAAGVYPVFGELDYQTGTLTVGLKGGKSLSLDLSLRKPLLALRDEGRAIVSVSARPAWEIPQSRQWLERCGFSAPEKVSGGWVQSCPSDPSLACVCRKTAYGRAISLELGADNSEALRNAEERLVSAGVEEIASRNETWWRRYWEEAPEIVLPDGWFNRFYKYALYKFAAATHPKGYSCSLQGPWQEEYKKAEWSGDYHFNVNVQQIYSLAFATGKLEHLLPLFDMLESEPYREALRHNARVLFGIEDGLWFTHAMDDRGRQCGWLIPGSVLDPACGAWTAQLYWNYFRYSGDREFLRKRAYPFMRGVMRGYESMLEERDGALSIPLAVSAEYGCSNPERGECGRDPSYQLAAAHLLAGALVESAEVLGEEPEPVWLDIRERLPQFTAIEGRDTHGNPETRIAIWEGQDLDFCHRHHSHLACIYPFETLSRPTPEQAEIIDNSVDHWIIKGMGQWSEWCIPWAAIIYTRLGLSEAPMVLFEMWKKIFVNEGLATVYLPRARGVIAHRRHDLKKPKETNEIMQLDGTMGAATALLEMLTHQVGDEVRLFAGVPEEWKDAAFSKICLPRGFSVSAVRGKFVEVASRWGGKLKVRMDNHCETVALGAEESIRITWPQDDGDFQQEA